MVVKIMTISLMKLLAMRSDQKVIPLTDIHENYNRYTKHCNTVKLNKFSDTKPMFSNIVTAIEISFAQSSAMILGDERS